MVGSDAFIALVWGVFAVGWVGVGTIIVAVIRDVAKLISAGRRADQRR